MLAINIYSTIIINTNYVSDKRCVRKSTLYRGKRVYMTTTDVDGVEGTSLG